MGTRLSTATREKVARDELDVMEARRMSEELELLKRLNKLLRKIGVKESADKS